MSAAWRQGLHSVQGALVASVEYVRYTERAEESGAEQEGAQAQPATGTAHRHTKPRGGLGPGLSGAGNES